MLVIALSYHLAVNEKFFVFYLCVFLAQKKLDFGLP